MTINCKINNVRHDPVTSNHSTVIRCNQLETMLGKRAYREFLYVRILTPTYVSYVLGTGHAYRSPTNLSFKWSFRNIWHARMFAFTDVPNIPPTKYISLMWSLLLSSKIRLLNIFASIDDWETQICGFVNCLSELGQRAWYRWWIHGCEYVFLLLPLRKMPVNNMCLNFRFICIICLIAMQNKFLTQDGHN